MSIDRFRIEAAIALLAAFALGAVAGAFVIRRPPSIQAVPVGKAPEILRYPELHLSPEQARRIQGVFDTFDPQMRAIMVETFPRVRALAGQMDDQIEAVLTPEQRAIWRRVGPKRPRP